VGNRAPGRRRFRCRESRKCARGFLARATRVILPRATEGWPSGLRRTLGKRVYGKPYRGFESHSLRQKRRSPLCAAVRCNSESPRILVLLPSGHVRCPSSYPQVICGHNCRLDGMARTIGKLTALKVDKAKRPGMYGDGGGLYLRVTDDGAKNWVFRFMLNGRSRWMGMGPLHTVNLAEARKRAGEHRLRRHDGIDPIEARRVERLQARLDAAKAITFKQCADAYIKSHRAGWRNGKHATQ